jgi:hypothetical protein
VKYKPTHVNHPSAVWTRKSALHYAWVLEHAKQLVREFSVRYNKAHATGLVVYHELDIKLDAPATWEPPPQCMPEQYRGPDAIEAYRAYYNAKSAVMPMTWRAPRFAPPWFKQQETQDEHRRIA